MLKAQAEAAANDIATALFEGEDHIETALARIATLVAAMPQLKAAAGLTVFHAQEALEQASDLVTLLAQARRKAGLLHRKLEATQQQIGLKPIAFGPVGKPFEEVSLVTEVLRVA